MEPFVHAPSRQIGSEEGKSESFELHSAVYEGTMHLLGQYSRAIESLPAEPLLSFRGVVSFYWEYVVWVFSLYALPFAIIINAPILIVRTISKYKPSYVGIKILYNFERPFQAINKGEVPALKLVLSKAVVKLFVFRHINNRIQKLRSYLEYLEFSELISDCAGGREQGALVKRVSEALGKLDAVLKSSMQVKMLLGLAPLVAIISSIIKVIGLDLPQFLAHKLGIVGNVGVSRLGQPDIIRWVILSMTFIVAVIFTLAANFIRKREIMLEHSIYHLEQVVFSTSSFGKPFEIPYDLLGYITGVLIYVASILLFYCSREFYAYSSDKMQHRVVQHTEIYILSIVYLAPLVYATCRRLVLRRY